MTVSLGKKPPCWACSVGAVSGIEPEAVAQAAGNWGGENMPAYLAIAERLSGVRWWIHHMLTKREDMTQVNVGDLIERLVGRTALVGIEGYHSIAIVGGEIVDNAGIATMRSQVELCALAERPDWLESA